MVTEVIVWLNSVAIVVRSGEGGAQMGICSSCRTQDPEPTRVLALIWKT